MKRKGKFGATAVAALTVSVAGAGCQASAAKPPTKTTRTAAAVSWHAYPGILKSFANDSGKLGRLAPGTSAWVTEEMKLKTDAGIGRVQMMRIHWPAKARPQATALEAGLKKTSSAPMDSTQLAKDLQGDAVLATALDNALGLASRGSSAG